MLGHITYLSEEGMHRKFGRELRHADRKSYDLRSEFSVETYLDYKGESFVDRFDANSYLYITRAMDYFDLGENRGGIEQALAQVAARCLVISFSSDWLFPPKQSRRLVSGLARSGRTVSYIELNSHYGHDSFLLPNPSLERVLPGFLARLYHERVNDAPLPPEEQIISSSSDEKRRLDLEMISRLIRPGESIMDLGCGDGLFLHHMKVRGCDRVQGVDNDEERVVAAIERGVDVILADLNQPLDCFDDNSFDTVVLSRTMQVLYDPSVAMSELLRIGQRAIVSFPNFGYWRNRHQLAWTGRVPVSRNLPFSWIETPNLHHLSLKDFESWCDREGIDIDRRIAMDYEMVEQIRFMPNLRATDAIYIIRRDHNGAGGQGDLPNRASGG
jgi:homoserine O-acetyltransferase